MAPFLRTAEGTIQHAFGNEGFKLFVEVDPELGRLYRSLIPKYLRPQATRHPPHITVVRREDTPAAWRWRHLDGMLVTFFYDSVIQHNDIYFWLNCWSQTLIEARLDMGLPEHTDLTRPPSGEECFHCTVANAKH